MNDLYVEWRPQGSEEKFIEKDIFPFNQVYDKKISRFFKKYLHVEVRVLDYTARKQRYGSRTFSWTSRDIEDLQDDEDQVLHQQNNTPPASVAPTLIGDSDQCDPSTRFGSEKG